MRVVPLNARKCLSDWHKFGTVFFLCRIAQPQPLSRKPTGIASLYIFEVCDEYVTVCCGENSALRLIEVESDDKLVRAKEVLKSIKSRLR